MDDLGFGVKFISVKAQSEVISESTKLNSVFKKGFLDYDYGKRLLRKEKVQALVGSRVLYWLHLVNPLFNLVGGKTAL